MYVFSVVVVVGKHSLKVLNLMVVTDGNGGCYTKLNSCLRLPTSILSQCGSVLFPSFSPPLIFYLFNETLYGACRFRILCSMSIFLPHRCFSSAFIIPLFFPDHSYLLVTLYFIFLSLFPCHIIVILLIFVFRDQVVYEFVNYYYYHLVV